MSTTQKTAKADKTSKADKPAKPEPWSCWPDEIAVIITNALIAMLRDQLAALNAAEADAA